MIDDAGELFGIVPKAKPTPDPPYKGRMDWRGNGIHPRLVLPLWVYRKMCAAEKE